jgi:glycosyltransferase involved in cell wall biosynthesis
VLDGATGYLINRDKLELKQKLELLLGNESLRVRFGKNSREHVLAKFTWDKSVNRFLKIIKDAGYKLK